jgi:DMSO/TMAO reductase YedYZ heme-binding membrane subunit
MSGAMLVMGTDMIDSVRLIVRTTARTSLAFFLLAFAASALHRLAPGDTTAWLLRHRRGLGLSFAMSHLVHAVALWGLYVGDTALFWTLTNPRSVVTGAIAYAFIAALAATSFDRAVVWLGPVWWKRLHVAGVWVVWVSFVFTNGKRIPVSGWYAVPVALLLAAVVLRVAGRRRAARRAGVLTTG